MSDDDAAIIRAETAIAEALAELERQTGLHTQRVLALDYFDGRYNVEISARRPVYADFFCFRRGV